MKQVLLSVPRNGYTVQTKRIEIPRDNAAYVLNRVWLSHYCKAVCNDKTVSLYKEAAFCPQCGRDLQAKNNNALIRYSETELEQWVTGQQSLFATPLPKELILWEPSEPCEVLFCQHCNNSFHKASEARKVLFIEDKNRITVSIPIDFSELMHMRWSKSVHFSEFVLTERITFNMRNGHTFLSLHGKTSVFAVWDITNEDVGALYTDPVIQTIETSFPVLCKILDGLRHRRFERFPFLLQEMNLAKLILMTRFLGYPRAFYDGIPLYDSDNRIMKSFSILAAQLHDANRVPELLKKSKLPQGKNIRKAIFSNPALMFYLPQLEEMWDVFREVNIFQRFIVLDANILFATLATIHRQPSMIDYFRDYCAAFSKKRLLSLLLMNDWRIYAGQYLAMNPFFRKEERKLWKRLGELPAYDLIDLGNDIGPKFSVPVPIIHPEMPENRIPDYMFLGYCFHRLCSLQEFHRAGTELNNCLVNWDVREHGTVYGVISNRRYIAAIEVSKGKIVQARAIRNTRIEPHDPLFAAMKLWLERFHIDGELDDELYI